MSPKTTHFVPHDQPGKRLARTLCGVLIDPRESNSTPSCQTCAQKLAEYEALEF